MFASKQIVWAKVKGYPWWPAQVTDQSKYIQVYKLPSADHNYFKVSFIGQNNHAFLDSKSIRKYHQYYEQLKQKKCKGLQPSIQLADKQLQKMGDEKASDQPSIKNSITVPTKQKKIKRKMKRKLKGKKIMKSQSVGQLSSIKASHFQNLTKRLSAQENNNKNPDNQDQQDEKEESIHNQGQNQQSSEQGFEMSSQIAYFNINVDRKKIQSIQEELFLYISKFNQGNFDDYRDCFDYCLKIEIQKCHSQSQNSPLQQEQQATKVNNVLQPQQVLQSKITNMLSYIIFKLKQKKQQPLLSAKQISELEKLTDNMKKSVLSYLQDTTYYNQYLKIMEKHVSNNQQPHHTIQSTVKIAEIDDQPKKQSLISKRKYSRKNKNKIRKISKQPCEQ